MINASGYAALARRRQQVSPAFCWAHVRRKFYERADSLLFAIEVRLRQVSARSKLADAIRYALTRWAGLSLFLADGRV